MEEMMKNRRIERVPIGPKTAERMSNTTAGQLAAMLSAILYSAIDGKDATGGEKVFLTRWICNRWKNLPASMTSGEKNDELPTLNVLRECRDILELYGYYEVID